ncbi:MAG: hypothetical protein DWQ10_13655 [Calditrichaeota bacterium]|nr:MAG: hypothetical protein DWQ10_13655 [Calditrichota bacterium]
MLIAFPAVRIKLHWPGISYFRNFGIRDGLQSSEFNGGSHFKSTSGEMFFGGINGFNAFHPEDIKDNLYVPPIVITNIQKLNKTIKFGMMRENR